ncbi:MAG: hypothetical protein GY841_01965, partial [FCB group bacterium]|nr:hypothetical protein [FCB group bacterium]
AASAILIEKGRQAASIIKQNLDKCELTARLITTDYKKGLEILLAEKKQFDLIFADPPYDLITPDEFLRFPEKYPLLKPGALIIMEHAGNIEPKIENILITRRFGDSAITIVRHD